MGIRPITHLRDRLGKQPLNMKNIRILRKKAEDQPRHKMIHLLPAIVPIPIRILLQQLHIQTI
jgi:hypothetical protein